MDGSVQTKDRSGPAVGPVFQSFSKWSRYGLSSGPRRDRTVERAVLTPWSGLRHLYVRNDGKVVLTTAFRPSLEPLNKCQRRRLL